MTRRETLAWILLALLAGLILGYLLREWLSQRGPEPEDDNRPPKAKYYDPTAGTAPGKVKVLDDLEEAG